MAQRLIALGLLFAASTSQAALAQPLNDPTRPPSATSPESGEPVPSRLQSVLLSPTRKIAVIDGRAVRLGERVGDATGAGPLSSGYRLSDGRRNKTHLVHGRC